MDGVETIHDLKEGQRLPGIVTNVTAFGAFVDIGVHQDGLVHISQLSDNFVSNPAEVVKVGQRVQGGGDRSGYPPEPHRTVDEEQSGKNWGQEVHPERVLPEAMAADLAGPVIKGIDHVETRQTKATVTDPGGGSTAW